MNFIKAIGSKLRGKTRKNKSEYLQIGNSKFYDGASVKPDESDGFFSKISFEGPLQDLTYNISGPIQGAQELISAVKGTKRDMATQTDEFEFPPPYSSISSSLATTPPPPPPEPSFPLFQDVDPLKALREQKARNRENSQGSSPIKPEVDVQRKMMDELKAKLEKIRRAKAMPEEKD